MRGAGGGNLSGMGGGNDGGMTPQQVQQAAQSLSNSEYYHLYQVSALVYHYGFPSRCAY